MNGVDVADATQDPSQPNRRSDVTRPVTIRQLTQARIREELTRNGSEFRCSLHGDEFQVATFVGNIIDVVASGENTRTIRIEDGTGKITSTYTINRDQEAKDPPKWRAGAYARVFGVPRNFMEGMVFNIYFIRAIEDPHEVFFHLMEAIVVTLQHSRGHPPPRLYDSPFARTTGPRLPTPEPDLSISMRTLVLDSPPLQSRPLPAASTSQVNNNPREDSGNSVESNPPGPARGVETTDIHKASDEEEGSTEYYTDQPPDSPLGRSASPTPAHPFARNHSFEGHSGREEGSSRSSQPTDQSEVRSSDEENEDRQTPKGKSKLENRAGAGPKSPRNRTDDELEILRSEFSSQTAPSTPPRKLKPDPYAGWSPAKRNIMVFVRSKTPGEDVNIKKVLGEGMSKIEMRNAIRELMKEGEIETVDGINYRLTDNGPKYPRF